MGPAITATLIAEIGDIWRFDGMDQLLAHAGVHPAERSSGRNGAKLETSWHMSTPATRVSVPPPTAWPWWASPTTPGE